MDQLRFDHRSCSGRKQLETPYDPANPLVRERLRLIGRMVCLVRCRTCADTRPCRLPFKTKGQPFQSAFDQSALFGNDQPIAGVIRLRRSQITISTIPFAGMKLVGEPLEAGAGISDCPEG